MATPSIPADYPRTPYPASIAGMQSKFSARRIGARFMVGPAEEELAKRHAISEDLAQWLLQYYRRKAVEHADRSQAFLLARVREAFTENVTRHGFDISPLEQAWIMSRVEALLAE